MKVFAYHGLALIAAMVIVTGCVRPAHTDLPVSDIRPNGAHLTQSQVINIAARTAESEGLHLTDYKKPLARYEFTERNKTWSVFFEGKVAAPGYHFLVWVNDQTEKAQLMRGK